MSEGRLARFFNEEKWLARKRTWEEENEQGLIIKLGDATFDGFAPPGLNCQLFIKYAFSNATIAAIVAEKRKQHDGPESTFFASEVVEEALILNWKTYLDDGTLEEIYSRFGQLVLTSQFTAEHNRMQEERDRQTRRLPVVDLHAENERIVAERVETNREMTEEGLVQAVRQGSRGPITPDCADLLRPLYLVLSDPDVKFVEPKHVFHMEVYRDEQGTPVTYGEFFQERLLFNKETSSYYFLSRGRYTNTRPMIVQKSRFTSTIASGAPDFPCWNPALLTEKMVYATRAGGFSLLERGMSDAHLDLDPVTRERDKFEQKVRDYYEANEAQKDRMDEWLARPAGRGRGQKPPLITPVVIRTKKIQELWDTSPFKLSANKVSTFDKEIPLWRHTYKGERWNMAGGESEVVLFTGFGKRQEDAYIRSLLADSEVLRKVIWLLTLLKDTWCQNQQDVYRYLMAFLTHSYLYPGHRIGKFVIVVSAQGQARKSSQGLLHFFYVPGVHCAEVFASVARAGFSSEKFDSPTNGLALLFVDEVDKNTVSKDDWKASMTMDRREREPKFGTQAPVDEYWNGAGAMNWIPSIEIGTRRELILLGRSPGVETNFTDDLFSEARKDQKVRDLLLYFESGRSGVEDHNKYLPEGLRWIHSDPTQREGIGYLWSQTVLEATKKFGHYRKNLAAKLSLDGSTIGCTSSITVHPFTEGQLLAVANGEWTNLTIFSLVKLCASTLGIDTTKKGGQMDEEDAEAIVTGLNKNGKRRREEGGVYYFEHDYIMNKKANKEQQYSTHFTFPWPATDADWMAARKPEWPETPYTNADGVCLYPIPFGALSNYLNSVAHQKRERKEGVGIDKSYQHKRRADTMMDEIDKFLGVRDAFERKKDFAMFKRAGLMTTSKVNHEWVFVETPNCKLIYSYTTDPAKNKKLSGPEITDDCIFLPCMQEFFKTLCRAVSSSRQESVACLTERFT